ncbi:hypothetical protein T439DRAFT_328803 [Meredithblackwellia eburnea MCA 4105]
MRLENLTTATSRLNDGSSTLSDQADCLKFFVEYRRKATETKNNLDKMGFICTDRYEELLREARASNCKNEWKRFRKLQQSKHEKHSEEIESEAYLYKTQLENLCNVHEILRWPDLITLQACSLKQFIQLRREADATKIGLERRGYLPREPEKQEHSIGKWIHGNSRMREARRCLREGRSHPENKGFSRY